MNGLRSQETRGTSSAIVFLSGLAIIGIAIYQTVDSGKPDQYTIGALLALALGTGVGKVADGLVRAYAAGRIEQAQQPLPPPSPTPPDPPDAPS